MINDTPIQKHAWNALQKLTMAVVICLLTGSVGMLWVLLDKQSEASADRQLVRTEIAGIAEGIRNSIRDLEEQDRLLAQRVESLEEWGPEAGPRVTASDLQATMDQVLAMYVQSNGALRENTNVLRSVEVTLAEIKAGQAAATRERDATTKRVDRLEARP